MVQDVLVIQDNKEARRVGPVGFEMHKVESFLIKKNSRYILLIMLCSLMSSFLFVLFGLLIKNIIDIKDSDNLTEKMMVFIILFLIIRFLMPLGYSIAEYLTHNMVMNSVVTLRDEAIHKISNADIISWKEKNKGEIAKCIDSMLSSASSFLRVICNDIVPIIMQTIMIITTVAIYVNITIAAIFGLMIIIYGLFVIYMTKRRLPLMKNVALTSKKLSGDVFNLMHLVSMDRAFHCHHKHKKMIDRSIIRNVDAQKIIRNEFLLFGISSITLSVIFSSLVLGCIYYSVLQNNISYGSLIMVATFLFQIFLPLNQLGLLYRQIKSAKVDLDIYNEEIQDIKQIANRQLDFPDINDDSRIQVNFKNQKFHIPLSKTYVTFITGDNGVGKSTIAQTLSGNISPNDIEISIDDKELVFNGKPFQKITYIPQDISLLSKTIKENISYFSDEKNIQFIYTWLKLFNFDKPSDYLIQGFGENLSGGQKQKLGILLSYKDNMSIYIFDEPTKGLDSETVHKFLSYIQMLLENSFIIIITHDERLLSSLKDSHIVHIVNNREDI
ncbi:TPA: ABC transporter ATP-binding protein [Klebsiella pneumoniae]|nr:ABC transporter ATP-binding protein [Klebsiella pneumoniae]HBR7885788.1 ABC transporter ATP-binding protein [Klebsiella pneumoniae]